tara:strand:- start:1269 stop:1370 length:102 start_codon:yes stop_codon:yes gene_type:complete
MFCENIASRNGNENDPYGLCDTDEAGIKEVFEK